MVLRPCVLGCRGKVSLMMKCYLVHHDSTVTSSPPHLQLEVKCLGNESCLLRVHLRRSADNLNYWPVAIH